SAGESRPPWAAWPRAAHGGLLSPAELLGTFGERLRGAADGSRGAGGLPGCIHGVALDRQVRRAALMALAKGGLVPRQPGGELADSHAAGMARHRAGGAADRPGRLALPMGGRSGGS